MQAMGPFAIHPFFDTFSTICTKSFGPLDFLHSRRILPHSSANTDD